MHGTAPLFVFVLLPARMSSRRLRRLRCACGCALRPTLVALLATAPLAPHGTLPSLSDRVACCPCSSSASPWTPTSRWGMVRFSLHSFTLPRASSRERTHRAQARTHTHVSLAARLHANHPLRYRRCLWACLTPRGTKGALLLVCCSCLASHLLMKALLGIRDGISTRGALN